MEPDLKAALWDIANGGSEPPLPEDLRRYWETHQFAIGQNHDPPDVIKPWTMCTKPLEAENVGAAGSEAER
jgi:hypothetical protein